MCLGLLGKEENRRCRAAGSQEAGWKEAGSGLKSQNFVLLLFFFVFLSWMSGEFL